MPTGSCGQRGFTYIGLLIAVVFFGLGSVGAARLLASTDRAEREAELLFIGHQFRQAICSYLQTGPTTGKYPMTLDELLADQRYPTPRRHLRRLFVDPITGKPDWGVVNAPEGGIMGVHSLSEREPQKRANFDVEDAELTAWVQGKLSAARNRPEASSIASSGQPTASVEVAYSYQDWKFVCRPQILGGARQPAGSAGG
jgi:type II secretory pathway pseudopilin PulG